jgi:hypothetical protein
MTYVYSDTGSGVQSHTGLSSDNQLVEIILKFVSGEIVNLIAEEAFCSSHSPPTENPTGLIF